MALLAKTLITKSFLWEKKKKGFLENPDKLGWAEVTEFLKNNRMIGLKYLVLNQNKPQ
jgi:hypothetical protein